MTPEALEIRDTALAILTDALYERSQIFKHVGKNRQDLEPDDQMPALIVLADRERHRPDGDVGAGEPSFISELTLAFLIKTFGDGQDEAPEHEDDGLEDNLQVLSSAVQRTLLTATAFISKIEGIASMDEARGFPRDGETYYGWARLEVVVQYRTGFDPIVPDDYLGAVLHARPYGSTADTPTVDSTLEQIQPT